MDSDRMNYDINSPNHVFFEESWNYNTETGEEVTNKQDIISYWVEGYIRAKYPHASIAFFYEDNKSIEDIFKDYQKQYDRYYNMRRGNQRKGDLIYSFVGITFANSEDAERCRKTIDKLK
jgi:hypothetical protein